MSENTIVSDVNLSELLVPERILLFSGKQEKADVLNAMIDTLAEIPEIGARDDIAWGIFHREGLITTGIGCGIAAPHFRLASIDKCYLSMAIIPEGITDYESLDNQPVRLVFMIIAGKDQKTIHVRILAKISSLLMDGRLKAAFLAANDVKTCMDILARAEDVKANT